MGASVSSPAMTDSAVSLLQDNLNLEERQLWTSLGPNWTHSQSVPTHTTSLFSFFPNLNYIPYMQMYMYVCVLMCFSYINKRPEHLFNHNSGQVFKEVLTGDQASTHQSLKYVRLPKFIQQLMLFLAVFSMKCIYRHYQQLEL